MSLVSGIKSPSITGTRRERLLKMPSITTKTSNAIISGIAINQLLYSSAFLTVGAGVGSVGIVGGVGVVGGVGIGGATLVSEIANAPAKPEISNE